MHSGLKYLALPPDSRSAQTPRHRNGCRPEAGTECRREAVTGSNQVGFPIRTFWDQWVFSPPPDLSQSTTSFIASCCQGIHQTPFSRLIRSRRRQALLRCGGSNRKPAPWPPGPEVFDPMARPRQTRPGSDRPNSPPKGTRQAITVSILDLERLSLVVRTSGRSGTSIPSYPDARTAFAPHSAQTQKRLVFLLSSRCQSSGRLNPDNLLSSLPIRQPNTPQGALANPVVTCVTRIRRSGSLASRSTLA
jgi:hypothetical protein